MKYAKIASGRVVTVHESRPELPPKACAVFVECDDNTQVGWLFEGGAVVVPSEDDILLGQLAAVIAEYEPLLQAKMNAYLAAQCFDGPGMQTVLDGIQGEYSGLVNEQDAAIAAIFGG